MKYDMRGAYLLLRKMLGILGIALPIMVTLFGLIGGLSGDNKPGWWYSISATYYANSGSIFIMLMGGVGLFLLTYGGSGYGILDTIINRLSGGLAIMIILFPCKVPDQIKTGLLNLPIDISNIIHCISAGLFFGLLAFNILYLFTKGPINRDIDRQKRRRNNYFNLCGWGIVGFMILQGISIFFPYPWLTIINESMMLLFFGTAWLIKGECIKMLNDGYVPGQGGT